MNQRRSYLTEQWPPPRPRTRVRAPCTRRIWTSFEIIKAPVASSWVAKIELGNMTWFVVALYAIPLAAIFTDPWRKLTWSIIYACLEAEKCFSFTLNAFHCHIISLTLIFGAWTQFEYQQGQKKKYNNSMIIINHHGVFCW